jgi:uncharacterized protein (DUF3820 family)
MKYLDLAIANETIKTIDIKGKEYSEVNQRIKAFRMVYPQGTIETEMLSNENGVCIFKAVVSDEDGNLLGTGTAYEKEDSSFINKTSYIENCETSAVGRALGMCGFGIDVSVASAEEVQNAINNQEVTQEEADNYTFAWGKYKGKKLTEVPNDYIEWLLGNSTDERMLKLIELATGKVLPSEEDQQIKLALMVELNNIVEENKVNREKLYKYYKVTSDSEMTIEQLQEAIAKVKKQIGE